MKKVAVIDINFSLEKNKLKFFKFSDIKDDKALIERLNINNNSSLINIQSTYNKNNDFLEMIFNIFRLSNSLDFDYTFILYGNSYLYNYDKMLVLIKEFINLNKVIGVRISQAHAHHTLFDSPRSPYVDKHFVLINNNLFKKKIDSIDEKFDQSKNENHIIFFNFLEKYFKNKEIHNFYKNTIVDKYGSNTRNYFPFSICKKYGLMTYYPQFDKRLDYMMSSNIIKDKKSLLKNILLKKIDEFFYLRNFNFNLRLLSNHLLFNKNLLTYDERKKMYQVYDDDRF